MELFKDGENRPIEHLFFMRKAGKISASRVSIYSFYAEKNMKARYQNGY